MSISPEGIDTFNPEKNCITNHWGWNDVEDIAIDESSNSKFTISIREGK